MRGKTQGKYRLEKNEFAVFTSVKIKSLKDVRSQDAYGEKIKILIIYAEIFSGARAVIWKNN